MKVKQGYMAYVSLWIPLIWDVSVTFASYNHFMILVKYQHNTCIYYMILRQKSPHSKIAGLLDDKDVCQSQLEVYTNGWALVGIT